MIEFDEITTLLNKGGNLLFPCSIGEVKEIERTFEVRLPEVYKKFLLTMGKGAGNFMKGSSCFYDEIFSLRSWAEELIEENGFRNLPANSFVFWMHQGYQFAFFLIDESPNPPVYFYTEVNNNMKNNDFILQAKYLTDFFYQELKMSGIISSS